MNLGSEFTVYSISGCNMKKELEHLKTVMY